MRIHPVRYVLYSEHHAICQFYVVLLQIYDRMTLKIMANVRRTLEVIVCHTASHPENHVYLKWNESVQNTVGAAERARGLTDGRTGIVIQAHTHTLHEFW